MTDTTKAIDREVTIRVLIGINPPDTALEPALKIIAAKATALIEAELTDLVNHLTGMDTDDRLSGSQEGGAR